MAGGSLTRSQYNLVKQGLIEEYGDDGLDETASFRKGYPVQAHHCICCSVAQKNNGGKLGKLAIAAGYDINNGKNNIFLPAKFGHMRRNSEQRHRGGHCQAYYDYVDVELDAIYLEYKDTDPCSDEDAKEDILSDLMDLQAVIKGDLENRSVWLYEWSEKLYNEDYREEGAGDLTADNQQSGSASGLAWVKRYAGAEARRKHFKNGNLKSDWYRKRGFPVPGGVDS